VSDEFWAFDWLEMKGKDIYFLQYDMFGYQSISIGVIAITAGMYVCLFSLLIIWGIETIFAFFFRLMSFPYFFSFFSLRLFAQANLNA